MPTRKNCRLVIRPIAALALVVALNSAAYADPNDPPTITQHPASQTVCAGVDVTFTVVATGENLSYLWRKFDTPIPGGDTDTLQLLGVSPADDGNYDVIVSNANGNVTSDAATLIADPGPDIIEQPATQEVCEGANVTLSVTLSNQATSYEDVVGSTGSSGSGARMRGNYYSVDSATTLTRVEQYMNITTSGLLVFFIYEADNYSGPYTLILEDRVSDSGTGQKYYSSSALAQPLAVGKYYIIGVAWPDENTYYWNYGHPYGISFGASIAGFAYGWTDPLPTTPPANTNASAYMQRLTTSDLTMTYQWRKNDGDIPGAGGPSYTIQSMSADDVADYNVAIDNDCGSVVSDTASLTLGLGLSITQDPNDQIACAGGNAVFQVTADGPDLTYQWRKDGDDLVDETNSMLLLGLLTTDDAGQYDAVVTNPCGSETSAPAALTVADAAPTITTQPISQDACAGQPVSLSVTADGDDLHYQWRKDGADIDGAIGDTYTIDSPIVDDAGDYDVTVSNGCGDVQSDVATLSVDQAAAITQQPAGGLICEGVDHTFTVVATGTNIAYQWRKDGENIVDATLDTYDIVGALIADTGGYDVVMTNNCGSVTSSVAALTVVQGAVIVEQPVGGQISVGQPLGLVVQIDPNGFPVSEDVIGAADFSSTGPRVRGNSYDVTQTTTLSLIEHYFDITTSGPITFFVYESTTGQEGPFALILEDTVSNPTTGLGFHASNPLDVTLEDGRSYIIGASWAGDHSYYWGGSHPQPTAFGESVQGFAALYTGTLPYQPVPNSGNVWRQRLSTVHLDVGYQWRKNGADITGADADTYSIPSVTWRDAGTYDVEISNTCGSITSDSADVTVTASLSGSGSPMDAPAGDAPAEPINPKP